ncbi:MAG TPA: hypothetical protein VGM88_21070 [Kofleriaceae bacterium]
MKRFALVLIVATVAACAGSQSDRETLDETIRAYNEGMRWQKFDAVAALRPPKERAQFVDDMDVRSKDLKITEYDIVNVVAKGTREARVTVKLGWYRESEGILKDTTSTQVWEKHGKTWLLVDETRARGDEMPGLAEAVKLEKPATK